jgi:hypothetical protein
MFTQALLTYSIGSSFGTFSGGKKFPFDMPIKRKNFNLMNFSISIQL